MQKGYNSCRLAFEASILQSWKSVRVNNLEFYQNSAENRRLTSAARWAILILSNSYGL